MVVENCNIYWNYSVLILLSIYVSCATYDWRKIPQERRVSLIKMINDTHLTPTLIRGEEQVVYWKPGFFMFMYDIFHSGRSQGKFSNFKVGVKRIYKCESKENIVIEIPGEQFLLICGRGVSMFSGNIEKILWTLWLEGSLKGIPSVSTTGIIYLGDEYSNFFSIHPNGGLLWSLKIEPELRGSSIISNSGIIYVPSKGIWVVSYRGKYLWKLMLEDIVLEPTITSSEEIIISTLFGNVYKLTQQGEILWSLQLNTRVITVPLYVPKYELVCLCDWKGVCYLIDSHRGVVNGKFNTGEYKLKYNLVLDKDEEYIYMFSERKLLRYNIINKKLDLIATIGRITAQPFLDSSNNLHVLTNEGFYNILDPYKGVLKWQKRVSTNKLTYSIVTLKGEIMVIDDQGFLYRLYGT